MLSTFLILPTNLFLAQWCFQPVEHRTLFKLQNNLTDGYLQTLQWANRNWTRDATGPLENWGKFICTNGGRRKNKRRLAKWKQTRRADVGPGSRRCHRRSTIQAIVQGANRRALPEVLMFACVAPDFFLRGLFVCFNWCEAFRLSSRLRQDKAKRQCDRLGLYQVHFSVTNTKTFTSRKKIIIKKKAPRRLTSSCGTRVLRGPAARYCRWTTAHDVCIMLLLSFCFLFAPYINTTVCLGIIMQSHLIFLFTMWLG